MYVWNSCAHFWIRSASATITRPRGGVVQKVGQLVKHTQWKVFPLDRHRQHIAPCRQCMYPYAQRPQQFSGGKGVVIENDEQVFDMCAAGCQSLAEPKF